MMLINSTVVAQPPDSSAATPTIPPWEDIRTRWLGLQVTSIVACCLVVYTTVSVFVRDRFDTRSSSQSTRPKFGSWLHGLCLFSGLCNLVFNAASFPMLGITREPFCYYYDKVSVVSFGLGTMSTYIVLWLRMLTAFYMDPVLAANISKKLKYFAFGTFGLLIVITAANIVLFIEVQQFTTFYKGCLKLSSSDSQFVRFAIAVSIIIVGQGCLVYYFIHPLCAHRRHMLSSGIQENIIIPLSKRLVCVMTGWALVSIACYIGIILNRTRYIYVNHILLSTIMLGHLLTGYTESFPLWKAYLFPCLPQRLTERAIASTYQHKQRKVEQIAVKATELGNQAVC